MNCGLLVKDRKIEEEGCKKERREVRRKKEKEEKCRKGTENKKEITKENEQDSKY